jgi:hypothetical protein
MEIATPFERTCIFSWLEERLDLRVWDTINDRCGDALSMSYAQSATDNPSDLTVARNYVRLDYFFAIVRKHRFARHKRLQVDPKPAVSKPMTGYGIAVHSMQTRNESHPNSKTLCGACYVLAGRNAKNQILS